MTGDCPDSVGLGMTGSGGLTGISSWVRCHREAGPMNMDSWTVARLEFNVVTDGVDRTE